MEKSKLNIKQVLLTAIVTCVFTVIAGVVTYFITNKTPALSYSVATGPALPTGQQFKKIYTVLVKNSGRKEVENPTLQVTVKEGEINDVAIESSPGLKVQENKTPLDYEAKAVSVNPEEFFTASLMITFDKKEVSHLSL